MYTNKKSASGAINTTDSKDEQSTASVAQQGNEVKQLNYAQKHNIILAVKGATNKEERIAQVARDFGIAKQTVRKIVYGKDSITDFEMPRPPMMERQTPTEWTSSETQQLRAMKEKGVANSEICKQLHKTAQQVSSKWYTMRKATGKIKAPEPVPDKSVPTPTTEPTPQVKTVPAFDPAAIKQPISEHLDIFGTLQDIMRQAGAGYASVSITRADGTKYRAEVRKDGMPVQPHHTTNLS